MLPLLHRRVPALWYGERRAGANRSVTLAGAFRGVANCQGFSSACDPSTVALRVSVSVTIQGWAVKLASASPRSSAMDFGNPGAPSGATRASHRSGRRRVCVRADVVRAVEGRAVGRIPLVAWRRPLEPWTRGVSTVLRSGSGVLGVLRRSDFSSEAPQRSPIRTVSRSQRARPRRPRR